MGKTTKTLLTASLVCFVVGLAFTAGWVNVDNIVALYVALPLGAVFFGLFLICLVLEKEGAVFDQEQRHLAAQPQACIREPEKDCGCAKKTILLEPAALK